MFIWLSVRPALGVERALRTPRHAADPAAVLDVVRPGRTLTPTAPSGEGFVRFYPDGGPDAAAGWDFVGEIAELRYRSQRKRTWVAVSTGIVTWKPSAVWKAIEPVLAGEVMQVTTVRPRSRTRRKNSV